MPNLFIHLSIKVVLVLVFLCVVSILAPTHLMRIDWTGGTQVNFLFKMYPRKESMVSSTYVSKCVQQGIVYFY